MNRYNNLAIVLCASIVIVLLCIIGVCYKSDENRRSSKTSIRLTAEQKELVNQLNIARASLEQAQAKLEAKEAEFQQLIDNANNLVAVKQLDRNATVQWFPLSNKNGQFMPIVYKGSPILWGFRSDGLVSWKYP